MTIHRLPCLRCGKIYVLPENEQNIMICSECQRDRPHRLDQFIPSFFQSILAIADYFEADFVSLNVDGLEVRVKR